MDTGFSKNVYYGYLLKGDLPGAIHYVGRFPEQAELHSRFMAVFAREQYRTYDVDAGLNRILAVYQRYYRDVFYLGAGREAAAEKLRVGLAELLGIDGASIELQDMEQNQVAGAFRRKGLHFLGGRTGGYYGPYVWRTEETRTYEVGLPDGIQRYTVKLLDGFICKSWIDYLSFGEIGTGGWADPAGIIHCVRSSYDFDSEDFKVSLLKHEAQHTRDLAADPDMPSEELEYRAKLVELIYSSERKLLGTFLREADGADKGNGHAAAASRIIAGFAGKLGLNQEELESLPIPQVQDTARALFAESESRISR